ncbi:MAG: ABC transporter substrate-binding protein [Thermomicrobiales bacterium]|nr:ABC transporter substrate-binding protein [Thermomicrobiales bacterium]
MSRSSTVSLSRRTLLGAVTAASGYAAVASLAGAQDASPAAGEWSYTDVLGTTVTLPERPVRIVANIVTAAALWDLGIKPVGVFDWTVSNYADGNHIAWGNIAVDEVVNVGNVDGNIDPELLLTVDPDIVLTQTFDPTDPTLTNGILPDLAERIDAIAPVLVVTDMTSTDVLVDRLVELGVSLGADMDAPEVVAAREAYEAKVEEFAQVAADKSDLTTLWVNFGSDLIYVAGPQDVSELIWLGSLGLNFANADSEFATEFWEELSVEQALLYPADVVYSDVYSELLTAEDLAAQPVFATMPAVAAGQVGLWNRDFPVSYGGVTAFLETVLETLRTAETVTGDATPTA